MYSSCFDDDDCVARKRNGYWEIAYPIRSQCLAKCQWLRNEDMVISILPKSPKSLKLWLLHRIEVSADLAFPGFYGASSLYCFFYLCPFPDFLVSLNIFIHGRVEYWKIMHIRICIFWVYSWRDMYILRLLCNSLKKFGTRFYWKTKVKVSTRRATGFTLWWHEERLRYLTLLHFPVYTVVTCIGRRS